MNNSVMDHVDKIIQQWQQERPDLETDAMETVGRVKRLALFFNREMENTFSRFGLHGARFDVLATLRRAGPPYSLSPGDLIASSMVTSGTMTNRLDQLEKLGLITRTPSPNDKRSMMITLTDKGFTLIDKTMDEHVKTLSQLTDMLSIDEKKNLDTILQKMMVHFENQQ